MKKNNKSKEVIKENSNKKKNIFLIIIWALILLLTAVSVWLRYFNNSNYKPVYSKDLSTTFNEVLSLNKIYNIAKLERNIDNFNKLTNDEKLDIIFHSLILYNDDAYTYGLTIDNINAYFGNTIKGKLSWDKKGIKCWCGEYLYIYDKKSDKYIYNENHLGHGLSVIDNYFSKIISIKNNGNIYEVTEVKLWYKMLDEGPSTFTNAYDTYKNAIYDTKPLFVLKSVGEIDYNSNPYYYYIEKEINENFDKYENNMARYIYTFEKVNDKYLLINFKFEDR